MEASDNPTVILDGEKEPQPDALLRILPEFGGSCRKTAEGYRQGPPELIRGGKWRSLRLMCARGPLRRVRCPAGQGLFSIP